jgi:hypothetical protein
LVETSFALAPVIEGYGYEGIPFAGLSVLVISMGQPFNEVLKVIVFVPILESDDGIEDLAIGVVTGAVEFEMPIVPHAVGADEVGGGIGLQAGKGLTALAAVRSFDRDGTG